MKNGGSINAINKNCFQALFTLQKMLVVNSISLYITRTQDQYVVQQFKLNINTELFFFHQNAYVKRLITK